MISKCLFALLVVATVAIVNANVLAEDHASADKESLLDPAVYGLMEIPHKVLYNGPDGKETCLLCQPPEKCGCTDIIGMRCETKRLKNKLHRLKAMAESAAPQVPAAHQD
jgi:hypothetical protein